MSLYPDFSGHNGLPRRCVFSFAIYPNYPQLPSDISGNQVWQENPSYVDVLHSFSLRISHIKFVFWRYTNIYISIKTTQKLYFYHLLPLNVQPGVTLITVPNKFGCREAGLPSGYSAEGTIAALAGMAKLPRTTSSNVAWDTAWQCAFSAPQIATNCAYLIPWQLG